MSGVVAYVDGLNLYHGIRQAHGRKYLWLDIVLLMERMLTDSQHLLHVHYFTAVPNHQQESAKRHALYLSALQAHSPTSLTVHRGRFHKKSQDCRSCGHRWNDHEEKETDVALGVRLVRDSALPAYDTAFLVSADSDFCPAVAAAKQLHPGGRVVLVSPPERRSKELEAISTAHSPIGRAKLAQSQLPSPIPRHSRPAAYRPETWI